jgi:two-component system, OmpR family, response regulator
MGELQQLFLAALPERIAAVEAALAHDDGDAVRRIAHMLRGAGGTYGFPDVSEAAGSVERAAAAELPLRAQALLGVLRRTSGADGTHAVDPAAPAIGRHVPARATRSAPHRVLLVDDDEEILVLTRFVLERAGFVVDAARDGRSAAAAYAAAAPDLLITDVQLAAEDGVTVAEALLQTSVPRPPLVFLTGAMGDAALERMRAAGAALVIPKPFDPEALPGLLAPWLRVPE